MKGFILHISCLALLLTAASGLASCNDAWENVQKGEEEQFGTSLQVTVRVNDDRRAATRAQGDDPTGGENGDGREPGYENEYRVTNATLLLYRDANGINSTRTPLIEYALYAPVMEKEDRGDGKIYYSSDVLHYKDPLPRGEFHAIILANMGDCTGLRGRTLAEVRDMTVESPFTIRRDAKGQPDIAGAGNFAMTSSRDASFVISGEGGPVSGNIIHVEASVERLAARIDFSPGQLNTAGAEPEKGKAVWVEDKEAGIDGIAEAQRLTGYQYVVVNASTKEATDDRFILTSVTPFNCLNSGTYYIKRVHNTLASGATEQEYLGQEKTDADGNGVNYVVDPWTSLKLTNEEADHPAGLAYRNHLHNSADLLPEESLWTVKGPGEDKGWFTPAGTGMGYYILDYTQENTMPPGHGKEHYATGLQLSGYYGHWDEEKNTMTYTPQNYHYYIRHADPNGSGNEGLPMKYGVVRNNIYRIHVNSVNSLGQIQIVVSEWDRIDVPEIQI